MPHPEIKSKDITVEIRGEVATGDGVVGKVCVAGAEKAPKTLLKKDNTQHPPKELKVGQQDAYLAQVAALGEGSGGCPSRSVPDPLSAPLSGPATAGLSA